MTLKHFYPSKLKLSIILLFAGIAQLPAQEQWTFLKHYDSNHLLNISLPLGGIGTGTVGLGGRGELRDWAIMNRPNIGQLTTSANDRRRRNQEPFFAIYVKQEGKEPKTKALIGPVHPSEYQDSDGVPVNHHGIPRFSNASFDAAYPFGQVSLSDEKLPVSVKIKGFNPFVPGDAAASSIPIAVLRYEVTNTGNVPVEVAVCGIIRNFIGKDVSSGGRPSKNINEYRENAQVRGIFMRSEGVAPKLQSYGTIALSTTETQHVTYRRSSVTDRWCNGILNFWDDFSVDGMLTDRENLEDDDPMASLSVKKTIAAGKTETFNFYYTWHFPNRYAWWSNDEREIVGNHYTTVYSDAWNVLEKEIEKIPALERKTLEFVKAFAGSDFPAEVKEAALFTLAHLRSQTVFRIKSGHLMGWEGSFDTVGAGNGSCTHVWNYETATSFLFGDLARTMRDVEYNHCLDENGVMTFRSSLPLPDVDGYKATAADGQMGTIMRFYRDYILSGDRQFLAGHWEKVKRALSFAWIKGGWDADVDGVMEGCQHNTMDVEYYGPNPQVQFWYLGALRAGEEMAKVMKDKAFEKKCHDLFANGSKWADENMFNGEYYIQIIMPPKSRDDIYPALIPGTGMNKDVSNPLYQLGEGCLVDQLVGQYMAHVLGLGYLANPQNIHKTYRTIMKYNYVSDFSEVFTNMRSYVIGNEAGLLMSSWPKGRLEVPFPYFSEVMTGYEYVAAIGMIYAGEKENGLKCIRSIRNRFDGEKRNPFDDPEYGHFYSRAMASWSSVLAISGFHYNGLEKVMEFTANPGTYFWCNGYSWGTCKVEKNAVQLTVLKGAVTLNRFRLSDGREVKVKNLTINEEETKAIRI